MQETAARDIVMAGYAGSGEIRRLLEEKRASLLRRFPGGWLEGAYARSAGVPVETIRRVVEQNGPGIVMPAGNGGIMALLWDLCEAFDTGLRVGLREIPVAQETIEICEYLDLDPYRIDAAGAALILTDRPYLLCCLLADEKIPAAVIGRTAAGRDKLIINDGRVSFLNRPR